MAIALKAENVSIRYITGDFKDIGLKEYTVRKLTRNYHVKEFMAVDGVSFALEKGDMLGIIGSNGAGKSTLLKAVAGIMEPTRGKITTQGEVAALLELGSGFDGDLTVKENAYLRGAMLGYTKDFMDQTYDQIIDFAELREFEDRPFKQLSSGMKSRLAFSIASLVNPDILILDEVLSVGDGAFQEKSAKKMREIIGQGATTILVSHSLSQIRELCNKVLWLDHGKQVAFGETEAICNQYEKFLRGECPAQMPDQAQVEPAEAPQTGPVTVEVLENTEQPKRRGLLKRCLSSAVLALFCVAFTLNVGQRYFSKAQNSRVEITAQEGSGTVVFRGAYVDGNWVSPSDHVSGAGAWVYDGDQAVYTAVDETPLTFLLPAGSERTLIFYSGPDAGKALINVDGTQTELSFWNETAVELGLSYQVPSAATPGVARQLLVVALLVFIATFILCLALYREPTHAPAVQREVWQDILRTVCCFVIVLLHCTCNVYKQFGESLSQWAPHMLMSCFTAFAVPCFYMISGASLLRREHSVKETWRKRIPQSAVPLLFWSVLYIFLSGDVRLRRFVDVLFREQWPHLWFMYCILGIYALLPLLSVLYQKLDTRGKVYLLIILLFVPSFLHDAEYMANAFVDMPKFAVFWPDLGLFFWGAFLWEQRERLAKWVKWYPLSFVGGLGLTAVCTTYASLRDGVPNQNFISCIASIGVLAMATSLFGFCMAQEDKLRRTAPRLRNLTAVLASVSFGIYLIHPMVMTLCGNALSNHGSFPQMILGAAIYFTLSALICVSGKRMRGIKRVI